MSTMNKSNISNQKSSIQEQGVNPWVIGGVAAGGVAIGVTAGIVGTRAYIKKKAQENAALVEGVKAQLAAGQQQP